MTCVTPAQLTTAAALARRSTASLGKFSQTLARDAPTKVKGVRRKFAPTVGDTRGEVRTQLEMLQNLGRSEKGALVVDREKAANRVLNQEQRE